MNCTSQNFQPVQIQINTTSLSIALKLTLAWINTLKRHAKYYHANKMYSQWAKQMNGIKKVKKHLTILVKTLHMRLYITNKTQTCPTNYEHITTADVVTAIAYTR